MSVQLIGVIAIFVLLLLMMLRVPVAYAMMAVSLVGLALLRSWGAGVQIIVSTLYDKFTSYSFSAIPMFILLGFLAFYAGILEALFDTAKKWIGHLPGGLLIASILGGAGFGAVCGSGNAASATLSRMLVPELLKSDTNKPLAYGTVSSAAILSPLIPPSVIAMLLAVVLEVSIGKVLIGGLFPGLLLTALFSIYIYIAVKLQPKKAPLSPKATWKERFRALPKNWDFVIILLIIVVGIYSGIFTATEAGAVSSAAIILILIVKKRFSFKLLWQALKDTIVTTCSAFFIVGTAFAFGSFLTLTRIPNILVSWLVSLSVPPLVILFAIALFFVIIGMFMDCLSVIYITVPILAPVVAALGYDLVWFADLLLLLTAVAAISPPFGASLFVMKASIAESTMGEIYEGAMPFFLVSLVGIVLCILFPQIILALPNLM